MVFDRTRTEYHFTPRGWIPGTYSYFGNVQREEILPPDDCLEIWVCDMEQVSGWSKEKISWRRKWISPNTSSKELDELHKKFPRPKD